LSGRGRATGDEDSAIPTFRERGGKRTKSLLLLRQKRRRKEKYRTGKGNFRSGKVDAEFS